MAQRKRIKVIKSHDGKRFIPVELRLAKDMLGCGIMQLCAKVTTARPFAGAYNRLAVV